MTTEIPEYCEGWKNERESGAHAFAIYFHLHIKTAEESATVKQKQRPQEHCDKC